jgi:hypothetical protein
VIDLKSTDTENLYQRYYHEAKIVLANKTSVLLVGYMNIEKSGF